MRYINHYAGAGRGRPSVSQFTERYKSVTATLIRRTQNGLLIHHRGHEHWLGLSLIHGADEPKLDPDTQHEPATFRLMEWKAKELGL